MMTRYPHLPALALSLGLMPAGASVGTPPSSTEQFLAVDIEVCLPSPTDSSSVPTALQHSPLWTSSIGLFLNLSYCTECPVYLRAPNYLPPPFIIVGNPLSQTVDLFDLFSLLNLIGIPN